MNAFVGNLKEAAFKTAFAKPFPPVGLGKVNVLGSAFPVISDLIIVSEIFFKCATGKTLSDDDSGFGPVYLLLTLSNEKLIFWAVDNGFSFDILPTLSAVIS